MMQQLLVAFVKAYRLMLSPWLGSSCRFNPTCSVYALQALEAHGAGLGSYLILKRLARCHPWCDGGHDPVPHKQYINPMGPATGHISPTSTESNLP
ncbi:MAG: membrane protein insertion efficiency factor YidD [Limnohabitans sp.]|nr:membrane protein insertion efficiency factor YidD [Limnohabitans sp.]